MVYVSLVEVFHEAKENFEEGFKGNEHESESKLNSEQKALISATISFFIGWGIALGMDLMLHKFMDYKREEQINGQGHNSPDSEVNLITSSRTNPDCCPPAPLNNYQGSLRVCDEEKQAELRFEADTFRLIQVGWFTALALTLHNIPEGLLTYVSSLSENPGTGFGIACAIGLHNIPEGIYLFLFFFY